MSEYRGTRALELWARRTTAGYPNVRVDNMTTAWRDGLAFCAIIHRFRPDLIDFYSLDPSDILGNCRLAFRTAERELDIPALLEPEDMLQCSAPDRLCVLTYLAQYYGKFGNQGSPPRLSAKETALSPSKTRTTAKTTADNQNNAKTANKMSSFLTAHLPRREHCTRCSNPVFLAERITLGPKTFHRSCFTCARCGGQLTPGSGDFYETESGDYCCETCPDEEVDRSDDVEILSLSVEGLCDEDIAKICNEDKGKLSYEDKTKISHDDIDKTSQENIIKIHHEDNTKISHKDIAKIRHNSSKDSLHSSSASLQQMAPVFINSGGSISTDSLVKARTNFFENSLFSNIDCVSSGSSVKNFTGDDSSRDSSCVLLEDRDVVYSLSSADDTMDSNVVSESVIDNSDSVVVIDDSVVDIDIGKDSSVLDLSIGVCSSDVINESRVRNMEDPVSEMDLNLKSEDELDVVENNMPVTPKPASVSKIHDDVSCDVSDISKETESKDTSDIEEPPKIPIESFPNISKMSITDMIKPVRWKDSSGDLQESSMEHQDMPSIDGDSSTEFKSNSSDLSSSSHKPRIVARTLKNIPNAEVRSTDSNLQDNDINTSTDKSKTRSDNTNSSVEKSITSTDKSISYIETAPSSINKFISSPYENRSDKSISSIDRSNLSTDKSISNPEKSISNIDTSTSNTDDSIMVTNNTDSEIISINSTGDIKDDSTKSLNTNSSIDLNNSDNSISNIDKSTTSKDNNSTELITVNSTGNLKDYTDTSSNMKNSDNEELYPEELNPFGDEEPKSMPVVQNVSTRRVINISPSLRASIQRELNMRRISTTQRSDDLNLSKHDDIDESNPFFGESDEEDDRTENPKVHQRRKISAGNPFWSDEDEEEPSSEEDEKLERESPLPAPRTTTRLPVQDALSKRPTASPRSLGSLSAPQMQQGAPSPNKRKKQPAPLPPMTVSSSNVVSPSVLNSKPAARKSRPAPQPPKVRTSTPNMSEDQENNGKSASAVPLGDKPSPVAGREWEKLKDNKDENNRSRRSFPSIDDKKSEGGIPPSRRSIIRPPDKSAGGKWKRKKGPAPMPVPPRRMVAPLPLPDIRQELEVIEVQQQGLEKQGVKLEQMIRDKCENSGMAEEDPMPPEVKELIKQLFELVNEKNELFRRQAQLMYMRRQQRLEEEHADLEYQIRCLMAQPELNKTDSDKAHEELLINRLLEVVSLRNEVVDCVEMDRKRAVEEDYSISTSLESYTAQPDEQVVAQQTPVKLSKKEKKKEKEKKKLKKSKKDNPDIDKDIDESESNSSIGSKTKEKKKKKWFI